jgi:hypothetical protein
MLENADVKERFDKILAQAQRLASLKHGREAIDRELRLVSINRDFLEQQGKSPVAERQRLTSELAAIEAQEREIRNDVQEFFGSLNRGLVKPIKDRMAEFVQKRLQVRVFFAQAAGIIEEFESFTDAWDRDLKLLAKMIVTVRGETSETYPIPESPFPSALVPAPSSSVIQSGKTLQILKELVAQIS